MRSFENLIDLEDTPPKNLNRIYQVAIKDKYSGLVRSSTAKWSGVGFDIEEMSLNDNEYILGYLD